MASLSRDRSSTWRIVYVAGIGGRRTLRIGKLAKRTAEAIKLRVEFLVAAKRNNASPDPDTSAWVAGLDDDLHGKLAHHGLVESREKPVAMPLGSWLDAYIGQRSDVKDSTAIVYRHTRRCLIDYFGADKPLDAITPGDCDNWRRWLAEHEELAPNTVRRRCGIARQFLRAAQRKRLLGDNPFGDMKGVGVKANRTRDYFITRDEAAKVLEACPSNEWRLLFALSRFAGLRCPSEHLALSWADVNWERSLMTIRSAKTAHHEGHESRTVPIFPELRPYLERAWDEAEEGAEFVIAKTRNPAINLRTRLQAYIVRAGLNCWPKLWQNLRASCETEWAERFPSHVVCAWIGHSQLVGQKHYLQVLDSHIESAITPSDAARNAAQSLHASTRTERTEDHYPNKKPREKRGYAMACDSVQEYIVGDEGLEPPTSSV
jgi:integrase